MKRWSWGSSVYSSRKSRRVVESLEEMKSSSHLSMRWKRRYTPMRFAVLTPMFRAMRMRLPRGLMSSLCG